MPISRVMSRLGLLVIAMSLFSSTTTAQASPPPVIGLFTDYGWDDPYVSQLKGVILTINPNARLLDLMHTVAPFDIAEGSYLLEQSAEEFPAGTIFVAVVDPQVGTDRDPVLLQTSKGKYFVGPDNGLFTHVVDNEGFSRAWKLDKPEYFRPGSTSHTFHGRDIFAPVAAHLADGVDPDRMGTPIHTLLLLPVKEPTFAGGTMAVEVLHIDRYGNVILNLSKGSEMAAKLKDGNLVKISVGKQNYSGPLVKTYGDLEKGQLMLLYGGNDLLEIAMNQGSAAKELKVEPGTVILLKP
ncbi:MAG: SAM-dependent chlorinase/fluorinase [Methylacidiphilales bacterium]|nr:SAM-dependent chlorinase/fluorinase [Candidatus Methylacidiphilales bacterium]